MEYKELKIQEGTITIKDVPKLWKSKVEAVLKTEGKQGI